MRNIMAKEESLYFEEEKNFNSYLPATKTTVTSKCYRKCESKLT